MHVFGPHGSGSISQRYGSGEVRMRFRILPFSHKDIDRAEIMLANENFNIKF
jgi:hypothetical protein